MPVPSLDLVSHCLLIDSYFPIPTKPGNAAVQLAKAITDRKRFQTIKPSAFNTFEDAVQARVNGFVPLQKKAATILAERGVVEINGKFSWRNDQRLKSSSMVTFTKDQCESFFTAIKCPMMLIQAGVVVTGAYTAAITAMGATYSSGIYGGISPSAFRRSGTASR